MACCRPERRPYLGYALLIFVFSAYLSAVIFFSSGFRLDLRDLLLLSVATHKITNILSSDKVTRVVRAPFVLEQTDESGSVEECPRGAGLRHALGELITCPYCLGPWTATTGFLALNLVPGVARIVLGLFAVVAVSDFLHHINHRLKT